MLKPDFRNAKRSMRWMLGLAGGLVAVGLLAGMASRSRRIANVLEREQAIRTMDALCREVQRDLDRRWLRRHGLLPSASANVGVREASARVAELKRRLARIANPTRHRQLKLLGDATLALAERRYHRALWILSDLGGVASDELLPSQRLDVQRRRASLRGDALSEMGEWRAALSHYRTLDVDSPSRVKVAASLAKIVERYGATDAQAALALELNRLGMRWSAEGRSEDAVLVLSRAIRLRTRLGGENPVADHWLKLAGLHNDCGIVLRRLGRYEEASHQFDLALEMQSQLVQSCANAANRIQLARTLCNRGCTRLDEEDVFAAVEDLTQAAAMLEEFVEEDAIARRGFISTLNNRAVAFRELGRFAEALEDLDHAESHIDPGCEALRVTTLYNRATVFRAQGGPRQAIRELGAALAQISPSSGQAPGNAAPVLGRCYAERGFAWRDLGELQLAIVDLEEAAMWCEDVRGEGPLAEVLNALATIHLEPGGLENSARAIDFARRACELTEWSDADYVATLRSAYERRRSTGGGEQTTSRSSIGPY